MKPQILLDNAALNHTTEARRYVEVTEDSKLPSLLNHNCSIYTSDLTLSSLFIDSLYI